MNVRFPETVDCGRWLDRWERQQSAYIPLREERFEAMLDVIARTVGPEFTALDLMCGPGAISRRILRRFPKASLVAIDLDPVLLGIGQGVLGDGGGRLQWVEGNLRAEDWRLLLPVQQVDAVLSTTAIHWLFAGEIVELYRTLATVVRPGGIFLNGDQMKFAARTPIIRDLSVNFPRGVPRRCPRQRRGNLGRMVAVTAASPRYRRSVRRARPSVRLAHGRTERAIGSTEPQVSPRVNVHTTYPVHRAALQDAGFHEVEPIWQHFDNRVLMAVR